MEVREAEIIITREEFEARSKTERFFDVSLVDSMDGIFLSQLDGIRYRVPDYIKYVEPDPHDLIMGAITELMENSVKLAEIVAQLVESHESLVTMLTADERREMVRIYENAEKFKITRLTVEIAERIMEKALNIFPDCEAEFQYDEDGEPYIFVKYWVDGFYFSDEGRLPEMTVLDPKVTSTFARRIREALKSHGHDYPVVKTIGNKDDKLGLKAKAKAADINTGGVVTQPSNWSGEW